MRPVRTVCLSHRGVNSEPRMALNECNQQGSRLRVAIDYSMIYGLGVSKIETRGFDIQSRSVAASAVPLAEPELLQAAVEGLRGDLE